MFSLRETSTLYEHQSQAIKWSKGKPGAIFGCEMGTGKTILSLALVGSHSPNDDEHDWADTCLIVAPRAVIEQWKTEIIKHFILEESDVFMFHGQKRNSPASVAEMKRCKIVITTMETLRSEYKKREQMIKTAEKEFEKLHEDDDTIDMEESSDLFYTELNKSLSEINPILYHDFGHMIVDEAHQIRNRTTLGFKALCNIHAKKRWCLSGTPNINKRQDIITLAMFLQCPIYDDLGWWKKATVVEISQWMKDFFFIILKDDVLNLPDKIEMISLLKMTPEHEKHYTEIRNTNMLTILKILRLRQACVNNIDGIDNQKFHEVRRLIDKAGSTEGVLVFCSFSQSLIQLQKYLKDSAKIDSILYHGKMNSEERSLAVKEFTENSKKPVMLISIKSGGVGLNLIRANHVIIMDPYWNIALEQQAIDRAHRIGQEKKVYVHRLVYENTIEKWVNNIQDDKVVNIDQFMTGREGYTHVKKIETQNEENPEEPGAIDESDKLIGTEYF
jgi:SNF2 family DNA or RNA helicase